MSHRIHIAVAILPLLLLGLAPGCAVDAGDEGIDDDPFAADAGAVGMAAEGLHAFPGVHGEIREDVFLTDDGLQTFTYEEIEGARVFEGDILLPEPASDPSASVAPTEDSELLAIVGHRWRNGVVPYVIPQDFPNKERILWAMSHIENRASVNFVRRNGHRNFITFRRSTGCASYVGRQGGRQLIWLADGCSRGNAVHELLHALGVFHEQSRPNRNDYVTVRWKNIQAGRGHNFRRVSSDASRPYSGYDLRSIMHYSSYAFSRNGRPTIVRKGGGIIRDQDEMSWKDARALNRMY